MAAKRESSADVDVAVAAIIADVRARGDEALAELSLRFDRVDIARLGLRIGAAEIEAAIAACEKTALEALKLAHSRVTDFHRRQKPADLRFTDPLGVELGWRWRPIDAVGLYVPGGAASYPSSVDHERRAGEGRGLPPAGDGRADAGRPHQSFGARRGAHRRGR